MTLFKDFNLAPEIQQTLDKLGFTNPTEIQQKSLPLLLSQERIDFHGQAQTGTGKTLAFGIPLLHRIDKANRAPQALVVAPTRELAVQICDSIRPFAQAMGLTIETIYGGMSMEDQIRSLKRGVHIVVGTPGRLNDHLRRGTLVLTGVKTLVLDEADIMLDMGFKEEVDEILTFTPKDREIWLFSATVKSGISTIMNQHMKNTVSVRVSKTNVGTSSTKQYFCVLPMRSRVNALCRFIECAPEFYGFIFCQTKMLTSEIAEQLLVRGYRVGALHGDMSQGQRNQVIRKFKNKDIDIVVATDVAARGIDIANLTHVINLTLPEDHESYVHRVGRTGRAGKEGIAITFVGKNEVRLIQMIQRKFSVTINQIAVPSRDEIVKGRVAQAASYLATLNTQENTQIHPEVSALVEQLDDKQVRSIVMQSVQEKFLKSILEEEDMNFAPAARTSVSDKPVQEFLLAVGMDDNITQPDVVDYLTKTGAVTKEDIFKIRIIKRRTFIEVPTHVIGQLLQALRNTSLGGRPTRATLVTEEDNERRQGGHGNFGGGRPMGRRSNGGGRRSYGYSR